MAVVGEFSARTLLSAFMSIAEVLVDHADAIDALAAAADGGGRVRLDEQGGSDGALAGDDRSERTIVLEDPSDREADPDAVGADAARTLAGAIEAVGPVNDLLTVTSRMRNAAELTAMGPGGRTVSYLLDAFAEISSSADSIDAERFALILEVMAELVSVGATETSTSAESDGDEDWVGQGPVGSGGTGGAAAVISAASVGALRALDQNMSLVEVIVAAADEGLDELESGVATNERLASAGVVDAAGAVFLLILDSFAAIAAGDPLPEPPTESIESDDSGGVVFRIRCVAVPLDTTKHAGAGSGDRDWLGTCAWLESVLNELGSVTRFAVASTGCDLEVVTPDAGRTVESLCMVARPTELSIAVDPGSATVPRAAPTSDKDDPSW